MPAVDKCIAIYIPFCKICIELVNTGLQIVDPRIIGILCVTCKWTVKIKASCYRVNMI